MANDYVQVANTRIRRSNIKSYGIATKKVGIGALDVIAKNLVSGVGFKKMLNTGVFGGRIRYLYITTYQNDNYEFGEFDIDIDSAISSLDGKK